MLFLQRPHRARHLALTCGRPVATDERRRHQLQRYFDRPRRSTRWFVVCRVDCHSSALLPARVRREKVRKVGGSKNMGGQLAKRRWKNHRIGHCTVVVAAQKARTNLVKTNASATLSVSSIFLCRPLTLSVSWEALVPDIFSATQPQLGRRRCVCCYRSRA